MIAESAVWEAINKVLDPELHKSLVELRMVRDIKVVTDEVHVTLALTTLGCPMKRQIVQDVKEAVLRVPGVASVDVDLTAMSSEELARLFPKHPLKGVAKVSQFLAIASGKGGVGKTTVAVNLALALSREGLRVGLLDADVYGPSIPVMLNLSDLPRSESRMIIPLEKFGLKIMSFGFFVERGQSLIWRGPLVAKTVEQFLNDVKWGSLDMLVVDLPPGTGDPSITIAQEIPSAVAVIVTTPQEVALADVRKAINMFREMNIRVGGLVENMSYFRYSPSSEKIRIFGEGGGETLSRETGIPLLGSIPLDIELRKGGDKGIPILISSPASETGQVFVQMARKLLERR